ncbi:MAG: NADH-quinone oxidoreductase subunit N [Nitrospirota bacterium]
MDGMWMQVITILPEIVLTVGACALLLFDLAVSKDQKDKLGYFAVGVLLVACYGSWKLADVETDAFSGMFVLDAYSTYFKVLVYLAGALTILLSITYLEVERIHLGEYYAFVLLATAGMMVMVSAGDLIMIYLGLELLSLSLYTMAGFKRYEGRSVEASAKYLILGSFSSAILLYGISILYGIAGTTNLKALGTFFAQNTIDNPGLLMSMAFLVVGFGFKVAAVPFHMWTPDVYEGSPTPVTAFMSVAPKAASFAVFLRVFAEALGGLKAHWQPILITLAIATMIIGNVVAIVQTNIKRMLAYSSIAHAGYALIGIIVGGGLGTMSLMLYLMIYALMNLGAFGVVILLRKGALRGEEITDFTGLAKTNPVAAFIMLVFMFSLAGIPPTAGFVAKFYLFMGAVEAGMVWLAVIGVLLSAVSAYYYLRVVMVMYMREPAGRFDLATSPATQFALVVTTAAVLFFGIYPTPLIDYTKAAILQVP